MIRSLQAIFYITWIVIGIIIIASAFIVITISPFEKMSDYLKVGTTEQRDATGPPEEFGQIEQGRQNSPGQADGGSNINFVVTDEMRREADKIIGEKRAYQFRGYDDLTPEERKKLEEYWGPRTPWLGQN